jgi:DNA-binding protein H-NS
MIEKTYAQLTREIQALQVHAEKLRAAERQAVIAKLNETIAKHDLKAEDLRFPGAGASPSAPVRSSRQTASSSPRSASSSTGAKYGDGQGNTWGGRGPRPAWLRDALSKGRTLESFAVSGKSEPSDAAPASQGRASGKGNANEKSSVAKSPLPPLYSHPKSGQTWSGRGPKPAWLKQGLKKRGASLNDFLMPSRESGEGQPDAAASASSAPSNAAQGSPKAKSAAASRGAAAPRKSLAEKIGSRTKASSSAATVKPDAAPAPASPAPAAKKAAGKKAPAKKSSEAVSAPAPAKTAAKKSATSSAPKSTDAPPPAEPATPAAPAKKAASKTLAKAAAKTPRKPSAKKTGSANKRVASSMAPPADTPPASSDAAAAPSPAQESGSAEGQEAAPGV